MKVYLAGPINACTDSEANDWREYATRRLHAECFNPMVRDYRGAEQTNVAAIVEGDKRDVGECNVLLANCPKPSVGTSMEVLYAHLLRKHVVVAAPAPASPWLVYHADFVTESLDEAIQFVNALGQPKES